MSTINWLIAAFVIWLATAFYFRVIPNQKITTAEIVALEDPERMYDGRTYHRARLEYYVAAEPYTAITQTKSSRYRIGESVRVAYNDKEPGEYAELKPMRSYILRYVAVAFCVAMALW